MVESCRSKRSVSSGVKFSILPRATARAMCACSGQSAMYAVDADDLTVAHDAHPEYASTAFAQSVRSPRAIAVQHHRAHVASVGRRVFRRQPSRGLHARRAPDAGGSRRRRCRGETSGSSRGGLRRPGGIRAGPHLAAVLFFRKVPRCARPRAQPRPRLSDDVGGPVVRYRRGAPRLHARDHVRGPGGDVTRASRRAAQPRIESICRVSSPEPRFSTVC